MSRIGKQPVEVPTGVSRVLSVVRYWDEGSQDKSADVLTAST